MIFSYTLIGLMLFVLVDTHAFFRAYHKVPHLNDEIMRLYVNAVLMAGLLLWPLVWDVAVASPARRRPAAAARAAQDAAGAGLARGDDPGGHEYVRKRTQDASFFESLHRIGHLQTDANTIITAAFAMGTLITSMQSKKTAAGASRAAAFRSSCTPSSCAWPLSSLPRTVTSRALIIRSAQKVCLNYAIGFVIAGIMAPLI